MIFASRLLGTPLEKRRKTHVPKKANLDLVPRSLVSLIKFAPSSNRGFSGSSEQCGGADPTHLPNRT
eukprot:3590250-Pyramimonas_sp.AAC.1